MHARGSEGSHIWLEEKVEKKWHLKLCQRERWGFELEGNRNCAYVCFCMFVWGHAAGASEEQSGYVSAAASGLCEEWSCCSRDTAASLLTPSQHRSVLSSCMCLLFLNQDRNPSFKGLKQQILLLFLLYYYYYIIIMAAESSSARGFLPLKGSIFTCQVLSNGRAGSL